MQQLLQPYLKLYSNNENNQTDIDLDSLLINTNIRKLNIKESIYFDTNLIKIVGKLSKL